MCGARHLPISACAESICALFGASLFALGALRGGRGAFRAGVRFHIARDRHRVYEHDPPPERLRSLNWTRFKRASFPFIACDEGLIGVRARRAIIRRNYVQLWQSDDRSSPTTDHPERMFDDESTISDSPDPDNTTTPQDHSSTRAKFDRTRAWEVLGFWGVTKVTSSERHTSSPP